MTLSKIREGEGKIEEAANILQEVQVETFGSMKKKEKTEFVLEQMRLCLLKRDFVRAQIISKKINPKILDSEGFEELKIRYHQLIIQYYEHHEDYINIYRSYQAIYNSTLIQNDPEKKKLYLAYSVVYILLSKYGNEQNDLIHRLYTDKNLESIPKLREVVKTFLKVEIMFWKIIRVTYNEAFSELPILSQSQEGLEKFWNILHKRVVEHNIRVISSYYSMITLKRLAELLDLEESEAEEHLCRLTVDKSVYARINRKSGEISFIKAQKPSEVLNEWSSDITKLLSVVEKTCHLIQREYMIHGKAQEIKQ